MESYYYPRTSRKILVAFLDMFNNISVYNYTSGTSNVVTQIIPVPLKYGVADKAYLFNLQQQSGKKYYPSLPSILASIDSLGFSQDRARSVNDAREFYTSAFGDSFVEDIQPVPYDYSFQLEIATESMDHLFQVLEQICPFFSPTSYLRIQEFDFLNLERNLRVELLGVTLDQPTELSEEQSRYFNAKISFKVDGQMYRPISYGSIIKIINTNYNFGANLGEFYSTSGLPTSATPPANYNWSFPVNTSATGYTKVDNNYFEL